MGELMYARQPNDGKPIKRGTLQEYLFGHICKHQIYSNPTYYCGNMKSCSRKTKCPKSKSCFKGNVVD